MKRWRILRGLVAACFLLLSVLFLFRIQQLRRSELSFTVASQFQGDMDERYVQLSCFWPGEQTTETMEYARAEITAELEQAYGELPAMKMAWGSLSVGVAEIGAHVSAAEVYRVSGDFFSIHPWPQISGSYRYLNNNSAVLNEEAAWDLFASTDCVGLSFSLDGAFYTVHGVCKTPGEGSQIYISGGDASVTFCELLLPEQWDGFSEGVLSCAPALNAGVVCTGSAQALVVLRSCIECRGCLQQYGED